MKKFLFLIFIFCFLNACQSAKDALTLKKKESSDEFLVEKKSPLVLPPDYGELPIPEENKQEDKKNEMKVTLGKDELKINETIKNSKPTSLEKSVLEKIK
tara:strand:- start:256 stop:555 length:300 start_codon:yes stop_codon:yes gene_type:complete